MYGIFSYLSGVIGQQHYTGSYDLIKAVIVAESRVLDAAEQLFNGHVVVDPGQLSRSVSIDESGVELEVLDDSEGQPEAVIDVIT